MRNIDADALKRAIKTECNPYGKPTIDFESGKKVLEIIDDAPTIDSLDLDVYIGGRCCGKRQRLLDELRPKGNWTNGECKCPCCGEDKFKDLDADIWADWRPNFCPNCGADMRSVDEGLHERAVSDLSKTVDEMYKKLRGDA